jgi:hypothetical protein
MEIQPAAVVAPAVAVAPVAVPVSPIPGTIFRPTKYHFKKDDLGQKRPTVELFIPVPTWDGFAALASSADVVKNDKGEVVTQKVDGKDVPVTIGEKVRSLVLEMLADAAAGQGREQVGDEKNPVNKQEELNLSKLTLAYIACLPPAERRGGGISKETWEGFFKNYLEVMPAATGKKKEQVENAGKLFVARLQPVKTQKKILAFLKEQLNLWFTSAGTEAQEEFAEVYEFLGQKIDEFSKRDEAELLANL